MSEIKEITMEGFFPINHFGRFGKEIKVSPKANANFNKPGFKIYYHIETVNVTIGIGNDHVAELVMSKTAWDALQAGERVEITTTEDYKKKYVNAKK